MDAAATAHECRRLHATRSGICDFHVRANGMWWNTKTGLPPEGETQFGCNLNCTFTGWTALGRYTLARAVADGAPTITFCANGSWHPYAVQFHATGVNRQELSGAISSVNLIITTRSGKTFTYAVSGRHPIGIASVVGGDPLASVAISSHADALGIHTISVYERFTSTDPKALGAHPYDRVEQATYDAATRALYKVAAPVSVPRRAPAAAHVVNVPGAGAAAAGSGGAGAASVELGAGVVPGMRELSVSSLPARQQKNLRAKWPLERFQHMRLWNCEAADDRLSRSFERKVAGTSMTASTLLRLLGESMPDLSWLAMGAVRRRLLAPVSPSH